MSLVRRSCGSVEIFNFSQIYRPHLIGVFSIKFPFLLKSKLALHIFMQLHPYQRNIVLFYSNFLWVDSILLFCGQILFTKSQVIKLLVLFPIVKIDFEAQVVRFPQCPWPRSQLASAAVTNPNSLFILYYIYTLYFSLFSFSDCFIVMTLILTLQHLVFPQQQNSCHILYGIFILWNISFSYELVCLYNLPISCPVGDAIFRFINRQG